MNSPVSVRAMYQQLPIFVDSTNIGLLITLPAQSIVSGRCHLSLGEKKSDPGFSPGHPLCRGVLPVADDSAGGTCPHQRTAPDLHQSHFYPLSSQVSDRFILSFPSVSLIRRDPLVNRNFLACERVELAITALESNILSTLMDSRSAAALYSIVSLHAPSAIFSM